MRRAVWRRLDAAFASRRAGPRARLRHGRGRRPPRRERRLRRRDRPRRGRWSPRPARRSSGRAWRTVVTTRALDAEPPRRDPTLEGPFDGAFSNFGALNCVPDLAAVSAGLSRHVRPGGRVLLCLMGRYVPWEWGWFLAHGDRCSAFRRLAEGGAEWRGLRVAYPTVARRCAGLFAPGIPVPRRPRDRRPRPPVLRRGVGRRDIPASSRRSTRWSAASRPLPPLPSLADHVLVELERR